MRTRPVPGEEELSVGIGIELESRFYRHRYQIVGTDDVNIARLWLENDTFPLQFIDGTVLYRQPVILRRLGHKLYESDVLWTPKNPLPYNLTIRGRTTGGTQRILGSLQTVATSSNAPDFQGLIGFNPSDESVEGTEITVPVLELSIDITYPTGVVNAAFANLLTELTGRVNSTSWLGWAAGEVLYQGADFSDGVNNPVEVSHNIAVQRNITGATIAGLTGITKDGWDLLWFLTEDKTVVAGGADVPVKQAVHWYVERVYPRANFPAALGF